MTDFYDMEMYFDQCPAGMLVLESGSEFIHKLRSLGSEVSAAGHQPLDLHAYMAYGDERYWWIIGLYNDIINPDQIDIDQVLIPNKSGVDSLLNKYYRGR